MNGDTMPSKQHDVAVPTISPVLFMSVDGEPMSFFLRPGQVKRRLQPLISAGGGLLSNVQQPGAILLIDPEEKAAIPETTAHWYVSTQYILDCAEKDEQLNLEDYRLNPEPQRQSARVMRRKESPPGLYGGRIAYTAEDDAAILRYVSKHRTEIGGNRLWQEMEKQSVTVHSWQSMKYRYRVRLANKQTEAVEEEDTEAAQGDTKVEEGNTEEEVEKPSNTEDTASPQTVESDLTQIETTTPDKTDAQSVPAESTKPVCVEAQTSISPNKDTQEVVSPPTNEQTSDNAQVETAVTETCNTPQPEGPSLAPQTEAHPIPAEITEPETSEPQTNPSPQKEIVLKKSPEAIPLSLDQNSSPKKTQEKQKDSPEPEQPNRRVTRRQLSLKESLSPELYAKKLKKFLPSPQPSKKTKMAAKSAVQKDTVAEQPSAKKARGTSEEEGQREEESEQPDVSKPAQAETESNAMPQKGEKKKEKRKLGILVLATKEFEDDSESDEDDTSDPQNPIETATAPPPPTSTEAPLPTSAPAPAAPTQSNPEHTAHTQEEVVQETQASVNTAPPQTTCCPPTKPAALAVNAACNAHQFIFDSESQEESQSIIGVSNKPAVNKAAAAPSLTQVHLEEDRQRITELMNQTNQDLVNVTKALLKTSGDFSAALQLLLNPSSIPGPFWNRCDDGLLLSADPEARQQLQQKYGEEDMAKRIYFLEVEG